MTIPSFLLTAIYAASLSAIESIVIDANLSRFGFNGPQALGPATETFVYADAAKGASNYLSLGQGSSGNWPIQNVPVDANLNPLSAFDIALTFQTDVNSNQPGSFTLVFTGQANVSVIFGSMTISALNYNSLTNTSKYTVTPSTGGAITCRFENFSSGFDASTIKLFRPGLTESDKYDPRFTLLYQRAKIVRWMDWTQTNSNGTLKPNLQKRRFGCGWAEALEISNDLSKDPWICIPHGYTDSSILELLNYWKDNLNPGLKLYIEWSNELWNYTLGSQFRELRQQGIDAAEVLTSSYTKSNTLCNPDNDEVLKSNDSSNQPSFNSFRRLNNEVYVSHSGLIKFKTGERYKIIARGSTSALSLIDSLVPALNSFVTITKVSDFEFKYTLVGSDTGTFHISLGGVPVFQHVPITSVSISSNLATIVHDGSTTFTNAQQILVGSSSGALSGFRQYSPAPITVLDAFTFTYPVVAADVSTVSTFASNSYVSIATNILNPLVINQSNGTSSLSADPGVFGQRLNVLRTQQISDMAKQVFGASFGNRCQIVYANKNFTFGPFGEAREAFLWWESAYKSTVGEVNTWLHYVAHAPYIYLTLAELSAANNDPGAAVQTLIDKCKTQYASSWKHQVGWAKRYGVKTTCYEAGVDTMGNPTGSLVTFPLQMRNSMHAHPKMREFTKALSDALVSYDVGGQVYYTGTASWTLDLTGATGGIADCWHIVQTMNSVTPIGTVSSLAPKLAGIDDYLTSAMVKTSGDFTRGLSITPNVNNSDYVFFETDSRGPAKTSSVYASQLQSAQRGGYDIYSQGSFANGYGWPKVTFMVYAKDSSPMNLYITWKHDPDPNTSIDILINDVVVRNVVNPASTDQVTFDQSGGFVETGPYLINVPEGANLLGITLRARQTSSQHLVIKSMRLE